MKKQKSKSQKRIRHLQKIGFTKEVQKLRKDYSNSKRYQELKYLEKSKSLKSNSLKLQRQLEEPIKTGKFLEPTKIISVTAPKWAIFDYYNAKYLRGYRSHDPHELSVFSKMLVFCTINTIVTKNKIDMTRFQTIVTKTVIKTYRQSRLKEDDIISLDHLVQLMLMDEGEQYELVAAVNLGAYLDKKRKRQYYSVYDADDTLFKTHLNEFYGFVNSYCKTLKLENIKYVEFEPSLRKQKNKCSASDIATLSLQCLKIPLFSQIQKQKSTTVQIKYINNDGILTSKTEKLINKTIQNPFISYFNVCRNWQQNQFMSSSSAVFYDDSQNRPIIAVVLASYNPLQREKDIQQIIEWYIKREDNKRKKKLEEAEELEKKQQVPSQTQRSSRRVKTQLPQLLQSKLKVRQSKYDFNIKGVKQKKFSRKTITQVNQDQS